MEGACSGEGDEAPHGAEVPPAQLLEGALDPGQGPSGSLALREDLL